MEEATLRVQICLGGPVSFLLSRPANVSHWSVAPGMNVYKFPPEHPIVWLNYHTNNMLFLSVLKCFQFSTFFFVLLL